MVLASGCSSSDSRAGRASCGRESCAETLLSGSHIHQCLVCMRNSWTHTHKRPPRTQSSDRSGLCGEGEIIYKVLFNVPVSFFLQLPPPHLLSLSSKWIYKEKKIVLANVLTQMKHYLERQKENNWLWKQTPSEIGWALSGAVWESNWGEKGEGRRRTEQAGTTNVAFMIIIHVLILVSNQAFTSFN